MNNNLMKDSATAENVLRIPKVVFDEIKFIRHGFRSSEEKSADVDVESKISKVDEGCYRVSLRAVATKENEYEASVQISGFCEIDESYPEKDTILQQNAVAILFAYVRSELTLITAQPDVEPIVLPVVNIAAMLQKNKDQ